MGRDRLQRVVDVRRGGLDTRRRLSAREGTFFWTRAKNEGVCEGRRRVPITKREFQSLCDLHDGGTFVAQCWWLHNMEEKLIDIRCGGPDPSEEICESFRLEVREV